jgi:hypothetical protein
MIIYLLSAGQGLYEIREVKLQENKECKYFQKYRGKGCNQFAAL